MNTVKNIHYLSDFISEETREKLEEGAKLYKRHANITFKVLKADEKEIVAEVRQDRNSTGKYLDKKDLIDRVKDMFHKFLPDHAIHARPKPYQSPPVDEVTPEWVKYWMNRTKTSIKEIEETTGIDKSNLSAWANGSRPMSQPAKAMFYFLFTTKMNPQKVDLSEIEGSNAG